MKKIEVLSAPPVCEEPHCGRACAPDERFCRKHGGDPLACGICGDRSCPGHSVET